MWKGGGEKSGAIGSWMLNTGNWEWSVKGGGTFEDIGCGFDFGKPANCFLECKLIFWGMKFGKGDGLRRRFVERGGRWRKRFGGWGKDEDRVSERTLFAAETI